MDPIHYQADSDSVSTLSHYMTVIDFSANIELASNFSVTHHLKQQRQTDSGVNNDLYREILFGGGSYSDHRKVRDQLTSESEE